MDSRRFVEGSLVGAAGLAATGAGAAAPVNERVLWVGAATRIARRVVESLVPGELKRRLPVQAGREDRQVYAPDLSPDHAMEPPPR